MNNEVTIEALKDLITINNDRIEGYEKAISELGDDSGDLKLLFRGFADNSREHKAALSALLGGLSGETHTGTTNSGKLYRLWMDMKAVVSGDTRQAVLDSCEFGEDAALNVYKQALNLYAELPADVKEMISTQKAALKSNHDEVKALRDAEKEKA
jgi:uncharacterized protein (TIGR02284 family)